MSERIKKLDVLRAIAIFLVVFGHSIILYSSQWNLYESPYTVPVLDGIKKWINLIQMPLFFFLAGFLFRKDCLCLSFKTLLYKKTLRLLLPYACCSLFWLLLIRLILKYPYYQNKEIASILFKSLLLGGDNGHLWYLYSLFLCFAFSFLLLKVFNIIPKKSLRLILLISIAVIMFIVSARFDFLGFCKNFIWFCLGLMVSEIRNIRKYLGGNLMLALASVIGIVCSIIGILLFNYFLSALCSLGLLFALFVLVPDRNNIVTDFISRNSFGIYLFHSPLVYISFTFWSHCNPLFIVLINFFAFGTLALLLTLIIRRTRLSFVIGEYRK